MQHRFGNRAVQRLIQPKLKIGPAGDAYEREADHVADQLMTPPAHGSMNQGRSPLRASGQTTTQASRMLQLKPARVSAKTTTRKFTGALKNKPKEDAQAVEKASKGVAFAQFDEIEISDGDQVHETAEGPVAWYKISSGKGTGQYIRATKVLSGGTFSTAQPGGEQEQATGESMSGLDLAATQSTLLDSGLLEHSRQLQLGGANPIGLNAAEGVTWTGAGILGMAAGIRDMADDSKSAFDRVNAAMNFMSQTMGVMGGTAIFAANVVAQKSTIHENAALVNAWATGYADMFAGLANAVKLIKNVVTVIKMVAGDEKYNRGKLVAVGGDLLGSALDTAKSVLRSIRGVNEALAGGTVGSQFAKLLPGLDIALLGVKSIQQGYYLAESGVGLHQMTKRKAELEGALVEEGYSAEQIKAAGKQHRTEEAQLSILGDMVAEKTAKIKKTQDKRDKIDAELKADETGGQDKKKKKLTDKQKQKLIAERAALDQKIESLKAKKTRYAEKRAALSEQFTALAAQSTGPSRKKLEERELSSDVQIANRRRVTRQAVHISTNLVQVGGSIAAIVSGPGAPAALALKLSAAGFDASLPLFRWIKQKGRDTAARNRAKGEQGYANKIFNADKGTAAKLAARKKQAVVILTMVAGLNKLMPTAANSTLEHRQQNDALKSQARRVEGYIRAMGCTPKDLYAANGKPDEQVKILVTELAKRELS